MNKTPSGFRLHIGIFGRRNVGKSSVLNALIGQDISIVSEVPGTTTDPVEKVMEFKPLGPVVFIDTAGIDDVGSLGSARVKKTMKIVERTDIAVLVVLDWGEYEQKLLALFNEKKVPAVIVANKIDLQSPDEVLNAAKAAAAPAVAVSAMKRTGMLQLREAIIGLVPEEFRSEPTILGDLISPGRTVVLVTPIDIEAPKGRLILPQVQTLRDVLDNDAFAVVVKENQLACALARLNEPPVLVVTDSQAFAKVASIVPADIPLTGFSILFARLKGDLDEFVKGALAIDSLSDGDRVLIAETCSHHPLEDDIGRVKLPRWLRQRTGKAINIDTTAGRDWPDDLSCYSLVIHCGSCMFNIQQVLWRIEHAKNFSVPITNYGVAIAHCLGMLERVLRPFSSAWSLFTAHS